jgi:uncharacterized membrane protein YecN with MAPEG domain
MTIPQWVLLGFAAWTLMILMATVGVYRWSRILTGRARIGEFRADEPQGSDWYARAMRAHANCVENLPVYGAVVLCATAAQVNDGVLNLLAPILLAARILQTLTHVSFQQTDRVVSLRFTFFSVQLLCMLAMGVHVAMSAVRHADPEGLTFTP